MGLTRITSDGITDGTITGSDLATNIDLVDNQFLIPVNMRNVDNDCSARISKTIRGVRE